MRRLLKRILGNPIVRAVAVHGVTTGVMAVCLDTPNWPWVVGIGLAANLWLADMTIIRGALYPSNRLLWARQEEYAEGGVR
jgi:hypothetical protein